MLQKILKAIGESSLFSRPTPHFWYQKNSLAGDLLLPVSVIYFIARRFAKSKKTPQKFNAKIICIGNAVAGGSGKTPTALAVMKLLKRQKPDARIAFISTGFKGALRGPLQVDLQKHDFIDVGDEALLLANYGTTIICKERLKAVEFADAQGFDYLILDDGLHDKSILKDVTFLVVDGKYGFGNGYVIPAGPLRDRLDFATEGADHVIMIGEDKNRALEKLKYDTKKDFLVSRAFINNLSEGDKGQIYLAFAGIGYPKKFFDMLTNELGLVLADKVEFSDHHKYTDDDFNYLNELAEAQKAKLITTEKDLVKLPKDFAAKVDCIKIELEFEDDSVSEILEKL